MDEQKETHTHRQVSNTKKKQKVVLQHSDHC